MRPRKLIWAGVLPPHQGGAAVSGFQLLVGLAAVGHSIRALAPITVEAMQEGERFDREHREFAVTRFRVPYFETAPHIPAAETYRELEQGQIESGLSTLIEEDRPHALVLGRETFAWRAPSLAERYQIPCLLRIAGGFLAGVMERGYPASLVARWIEQARKADVIVAQTTSVAADLTALGLTRIRIIPNAVDLRLFTPGPKDSTLQGMLNIREDQIVVMHVSNLKPQKRALDVIDSAASAVRVNPKLVYVIVGDGLQRRALEEACRVRDIADRVRFVGWVQYASVPAYLNVADVVVMPSESEAQARVYLETQACARTLIASDIPGARHVVTHEETGLLFPKGDVGELTKQTLRAAADAPLRARLGARAQERVLAHSINHIAARYSEAIDEIIEARAVSGSDSR